MNYDQFLEAYNQLKLTQPVKENHSIKCINSDYGDYLAECTNSYYCFDTSYSKDIIYIFDSHKAVNCCDGDYVVESESCYECVDPFKAYNSTYLDYCARIYDSHFCYDCNDSNNLFGCVYLTHKQYCIFNRQYSKEEYFQKTKELLKLSPEENLRRMEELKQKFPVTTSLVTHAENSEYGNHVHYSKNMYLCFDSARSENCAYLYDAHRNKNCYDLTQTFSSEFGDECVDCNKLNNCFFMENCDHVFDSGFCESCMNSNHLFGCVCLNNKQYCILNRQYSKEDYEKQVKVIMEFFKRQEGN